MQKFHSGTDSVSGSDSEWRRRSHTRFSRCTSTDSGSDSGKKIDHLLHGCESIKTKEYKKKGEEQQQYAEEEEEDDVATSSSRRVSSPCKSSRSFHSLTPLHSDKWPSVTKIRQIFDKRQRSRAPAHKADTCLAELRRSESAASLPRSSPHEACSLSQQGKKGVVDRAQGREDSSLSGNFCYGMVFNPKAVCQGYSEDQEAALAESQSAHKNNFSGRTSLPASSSRSCTGLSHYRGINTSPIRSQSPSSGAQTPPRTLRTIGLTSNPGCDLRPPATSSVSRPESPDTTSCLSSPRQPIVRERRDRQGVGLPRDSLHSSHSSSRAPALTTSPSPSSAPTPDKAITSCSSAIASSAELRAPARVASSLSPCWRLSSGDEEEECSRQRKESSGGSLSVPTGPASFIPSIFIERSAKERAGSYLSSSKNGWRGNKSIGRSSGSEEDSPSSLGPRGREAVRRRSLRKKKKASGASVTAGRNDYNDDDHDGESDDSDSDSLTMEHIERQHQQGTGGDLAGTRPRSHSVREHSSHAHRARVQQWERIFSPATSSTLPGLSRVSKVNIPSFLSSPVGLSCSSRYSSTETLKDEEQVGGAKRAANSRLTSSSVLSKTYHGNFTMYRSPSFGHGDNFSRTPVRVRPKIVPTVAPVPTALARGINESVSVGASEVMAGSARGVAHVDKNRISMSNPDITSETMSLLSFLKSDLSELKVRKTSGDKSGAAEGSAVYRMGSRTHSGTLSSPGRRLSLKDLTATLRRTKSFTHADKPSPTVRCYLTGRTTMRSASEQQLDLEDAKDEGKVTVADREVESDGGDFRVGRRRRFKDYRFDDDDEDEVISPFNERYVQEARQVIRDICQMSSREDDDADLSRTDDNSQDECFLVAKAKDLEGVKPGLRAGEEARTDQEAEFKSTKDRDKHERERENRERERSKRDGQSMQLEKLNSRGTDLGEKVKRQSGEPERALLKGDSEENMFYDRSVDELSGHESSFTDEGIVTEPEIRPNDASEKSFLGSAGLNCGSKIARDVHGQPVTAWKQSALHDVRRDREDVTEDCLNGPNCLNEVDVRLPTSLDPQDLYVADRDGIIMKLSSSVDSSDVNLLSDDVNPNSGPPQRPMGTTGGGSGVEAAVTPSANRRRRKFAPHGNSDGINSGCAGGDFLNGNKSESTMEAAGNGASTAYRSLSDPMPQCCCTAAEEGNSNFSSVDSNLLGSLSVKGGGCPPEALLPEYKGSMASDLSTYNDSSLRDDAPQDYSAVIQSIVAEPGALDRLMMEEQGSGKTPKKKSFSDPSRRSDTPLLLQTDPQFTGQVSYSSTEPICELDPSGHIPPSSSEPILNEQRGEVCFGEADHPLLMPQQHLHPDSAKLGRKGRSKSECTPHSGNPDDVDDIGDRSEEGQEKLNIDSKLPGILSPRVVRRPGRKRPNRLAQFFSHDDPFEPSKLCSESQEGQGPRYDLTPPLPLPPLQSALRSTPKHIRHASEPTSFIPISPPPLLQLVKETDCLSTLPSNQQLTLGKPPGEEAPSLEDVSQKYILHLNTERDAEGPETLAAAKDSTPLSSGVERTSDSSPSGITEVGPQKKCAEDTATTATTQKAKPRVVSLNYYFFIL